MDLKKNKFLILSVSLNVLMFAVIIYLFANKRTTVREEVLEYENGTVGKKIKFINVDAGKYKPVQIMIVEGYYRNGNLRMEGCMVNGDWDFCKVYSPEKNKELISYISLGRGKINIPDSNGKVSPENTFYPMENMNCYYRYGETLTREEYERREKLQEDRFSKAKFLPKNSNN